MLELKIYKPNKTLPHRQEKKQSLNNTFDHFFYSSGIMVRVYADDPEDLHSIPSWSYQRLKKW